MNQYLIALLLAPSSGVRLHIDGEGFLRFARGSDAVYAADTVIVVSHGVLTTPEGYPLLPQIHIPAEGHSFSVGIDGLVTVQGKTAGRIVLSSFGATRLEKTGKYFTSYAHGTIGYPGDGIFGVIKTNGAANPGGASTHHTTSTAAQAGPSIEINLQSEVVGAEILMRDIATITGEDAERIGAVSLGAAPLYGTQRGLTRVNVIARLKNAGIDTDPIAFSCPTGATVSRKAQKVDSDAMLKAALDGVKAQLGSLGDLRLDRPVPDLLAPVGELKLEVKQVIPSGDGATVYLEISVDGVVASHRTIGLVPTTPALVVHANDPVKIRVLKNGATVEITGRLRSTGRVGSVVSVESETGSVFTGILRSPSIVEVKL